MEEGGPRNEIPDAAVHARHIADLGKSRWRGVVIEELLPDRPIGQDLEKIDAHPLGVLTARQRRHGNAKALVALAAGRLARPDAPAGILQVAEIGISGPEQLLYLHAVKRPDERTEADTISAQQPGEHALGRRRIQ